MDELSAGEPLGCVTARVGCRRDRRIGAVVRPRVRGAGVAGGLMTSSYTAHPSSLDLARAAYREISLYAPDRSPCTVDLSDNTNLFGVPPAALLQLRDSEQSTISRYPSLYAAGLKAALAAYRGVDPSEIVTGCGSDDVLDSAIRAFAEPGDLVAHCEPSFAMIPIFARMNGVRATGVPLLPSYDIDAEALLATGARIIYICSPNNPTGTSASHASIRRVLDEAPGLVIV